MEHTLEKEREVDVRFQKWQAKWSKKHGQIVDNLASVESDFGTAHPNIPMTLPTYPSFAMSCLTVMKRIALVLVSIVRRLCRGAGILPSVVDKVPAESTGLDRQDHGFAKE